MKSNDYEINILRKFYVKHPVFRIVFDFIDNILSSVLLACYVFALLFFVGVIVLLYLLLPDDINTAASAITGGFLSLIIFPLIKEFLKVRVQMQNEQFIRSYKFYVDFSTLIIKSLKSETETNITQLATFIEEKYPENCVSIPTKISNCVFYLYDECLMYISKKSNVNSNIDNFRYFARRCIKLIRKQGNIEGFFAFDKRCCCDKRMEAYVIEHIN